MEILFNYYCDLVAMIKIKFGKDHLYSEIFTEDEESYIISTINNNGNLYDIKV